MRATRHGDHGGAGSGWRRDEANEQRVARVGERVCGLARCRVQASGPLAFARRRPEAEKQLALADRVILNK
eukprot:67861-Prymnesium_polylepis.1